MGIHSRAAKEAHNMNLSFALFFVAFCSLFFLAVPVLHLFQNRADVLVRQVGVDSISTIVGLMGLFTVSALLRLHRRLSELEKASSLPQKSE